MGGYGYRRWQKRVWLREVCGNEKEVIVAQMLKHLVDAWGHLKEWDEGWRLAGVDQQRRVFGVEMESVEDEEVFRESMGDRYIAPRSYDIWDYTVKDRRYSRLVIEGRYHQKDFGISPVFAATDQQLHSSKDY